MPTLSSSAPALAAYRNLLRAAAQAFRGDTTTLAASRKELRSKFQESASLAPGSAELDKALADASEAADFLRTFVVQAKLNERGNYEMRLEPHHADAVAEEAAIRGSRRDRSGGGDGGCGGGGGGGEAKGT